MIGYVTIGAADLTQAIAFYSTLLADLGISVLRRGTERVAAFRTDQNGPMLVVLTPFNQEAPNPGNGNMVAIPVGSKKIVDKLYALALELGGSDEGAPGEREDFYGAYFRDIDGNKLCFYHMG